MYCNGRSARIISFVCFFLPCSFGWGSFFAKSFGGYKKVCILALSNKQNNMKKSIYCYSADENTVRNYLNNWGVNFKERDGVFKIDPLEVKAVSNKLSEKLIIHIIG